MSTSTVYDTGRTLVEIATGCIRAFAGDGLSRADAEHYLNLWPHRAALSADEWQLVLDEFGPERQLVPNFDYLLTGVESSGLYPQAVAS